MVATIWLIILALVWRLTWLILAGWTHRRAKLPAGGTQVAASDSNSPLADERSHTAAVSPKSSPAHQSGASAAPGPVRGKVLPFPMRAAGRDAVLATPQGSRALYVYWDSSRVGDEHLRTVLGEAEWQRSMRCLRVFDITAGGFPGQAGEGTLVIELPEQADHQVINQGIRPDHRYVISYERRTANGQYYLLSRSAPVWLPPDTPPVGRLLHRLQARQPGNSSGTP